MREAAIKTSILSLCTALFMSVAPAFAQMRSDQLITPADFTPVEAQYYPTLAPDAQHAFIVTRSYVRLSDKVIDQELPAVQFPDQPDELNPSYLLADDSFDLNTALLLHLEAKYGPERSAMSASRMLSASDLTAAELARFRKLDAIEGRRFLATRSYLRLCQQFVDQKSAGARLPRPPPGTRGSYLSRDEQGLILDVFNSAPHH